MESSVEAEVDDSIGFKSNLGKFTATLELDVYTSRLPQMFKASVDPVGSRCCSSLQLLYLTMSLSVNMGTLSTGGHLGEK